MKKITSYEALPEGYEQCMKVDLKNDKKLALCVNLAAALIVVAMVVCAVFIVPFSATFSDEPGAVSSLVKILIFLAGDILYIICHELIHGLFIRIYTKKRAHYGFTGIYAFAGSKDYITKVPYIVIALAPVVVFAVIFAVALVFVPIEWFWVVYAFQIVNISGAVGDFYVFGKFTKLPSDILVQDTGTAMTVYSKQK